MTKLKNEVDKLKGLEKRFGSLPANIGFDPYLGWELHCSSCNSKIKYFANQLGISEREAFKRSKNPGKLCRSCGDRPHRIKKLSRPDAYHFNLIKRRGTTVNERAFNTVN